MSEADQELAMRPETLRCDRRVTRETIAAIDAGLVPEHHGIRVPLLDEIFARYDAARRAADEAWAVEVARRPIDDAAWERELERRRKYEERRR
jgi:hypothetical protein